MDPDDAAEFRRRAKVHAECLGFRADAEDLAQDVMVKWLSGGGEGQLVTQAVVDAVRARYGDSRTPGFKAMQRLTAKVKPLASVRGKRTPTDETSNSEDDFSRFVKILNPIDRAVLSLLFVWGLDQQEVAKCFGVTPGAISLRLKRIRQELMKSRGVRELGRKKEFKST